MPRLQGPGVQRPVLPLQAFTVSMRFSSLASARNNCIFAHVLEGDIRITHCFKPCCVMLPRGWISTSQVACPHWSAVGVTVAAAVLDIQGPTVHILCHESLNFLDVNR